MKVSELKSAVEQDIGDTIELSQFLRWLNDGRRIVKVKERQVYPNKVIKEYVFDLTADSGNEIDADMPENSATIDRIEYVNSDSLSNKPIKIRNTIFDEKDYKTHLRWLEVSGKIRFRSLYEDITNVKVYYWEKIGNVNYSEEDQIDDDIGFYDEGFESILVEFILFRYYKSENLETNWKEYRELFYASLEEYMNSLEPILEPVEMDIDIENGID